MAGTAIPEILVFYDCDDNYSKIDSSRSENIMAGNWIWRFDQDE